jgi:peptidoglycan/xylan/chitin deacetylase (PgdA/CDA1 family)
LNGLTAGGRPIRVPPVPLYAVFRAFGIAFVAISTLTGVLVAGLQAGDAMQIFAFMLFGFLFIVGLYLVWVYLPDVDVPHRLLRPVTGKKLIALTFDDGPNGADTAEVLNTLKRYDARATFFCVGNAVRRHPELVRRMYEEGHEVGNHTLEHKKLAWCSPAEIARQVDEGQRAIVELGLPPPTLFRAPHGFKSPFLPAALRRAGLRLVSWSHGVWDTDRPGVNEIVRRAVRYLRDGEVLLLHDGTLGADRSQTARALDEILRECEQRGLRAVTLPQLLSAS